MRSPPHGRAGSSERLRRQRTALCETRVSFECRVTQVIQVIGLPVADALYFTVSKNARACAAQKGGS